MAKQVVDYGTRQVEVNVDPAMEAGSRDLGITIDNQYRMVEADPGKLRGRMRDPAFEQKMQSLHQRLRATGITPATVFNFLPIPIGVNSPMAHARQKVPAVKGKAPYATRVFGLEIVPFNTGDTGRVPYEYHPIQLAEAYEREYPHGGVVALREGEEDTESGKARLKKAASDAVKWMKNQVAEGDRYWQAPDRFQRRNVGNGHRWSAQRLFDLGILKALPEWMAEERDLESVQLPACVCGKVPDSPTTIRCTCGYILNVEEALKRNLIDENSEELERLTRSQVQALGISDFVAETSDERQVRLKAGVPKPPSKAVERVLAAEAALQK